MDILVARQPIFDRNQRVFGYELLYRSADESCYFNGDQQTSDVLTNSLMLIGMGELTNGKWAFVNFTENMIKKGIATILPKELVAIEILENIEPSSEVIHSCLELKKRGYLLVLDDFKYYPKFDRLIKLADVIKIDFQESSLQEINDMLEKMGNIKAKFLAEKVETDEDFQWARQMGFSYFQGYFFSRPTTVLGKDIPISLNNKIQLMKEICKPDLEFNDVVKIIERDISLSYKLLRFINSAAFKFKNDITSLKHALVILGIEELKKWACLVLFREMSADKPDEIMRISMIRAKFSESLVAKAGWAKYKPTAFLMGLFSMIDVIMERELPCVLSELPLAMEIKRALLGEQENLLTEIYHFIILYEKGQWDLLLNLAKKWDLEISEISSLFRASVKWTNEAI
jgi:c-di-GMP-related signal transduction protein